jgi:hypothetical protein
MLGAIVRWDRGAAAPLKPMARAQRATAPTAIAHRAHGIRASALASRRLVRAACFTTGTAGGNALATKSAVELAAWLPAFTCPVPGNKRPRTSEGYDLRRPCLSARCSCTEQRGMAVASSRPQFRCGPSSRRPGCRKRRSKRRSSTRALQLSLWPVGVRLAERAI